MRESRANLVRRARNAGLVLDPEDIVWDEVYGWTIDGMDAVEWIDAMTMD